MEFKIQNNAITEQEANHLVSSIINTEAFQSLKEHCERKGEDIVILFERDATVLKCEKK